MSNIQSLKLKISVIYMVKSLGFKSKSKSKSLRFKSESKSKSPRFKSKSKSKFSKTELESGLESKSGLKYYKSGMSLI